jgi:acyl-CoA dehydrogenase
MTWHIPEEDESSHEALAKTCRDMCRAMGEQGLLESVVPLGVENGPQPVDVRSISLAREILCYESVLADAIYTMQGLGTAALWYYGSEDMRKRYLPGARKGTSIAALALSEPNAGSDVAALSTTATKDGNHYVINGEKTWISNAGIADHYIVYARTGEAPGARGLSAFFIDAGHPGMSPGPAIDFIAPHPAAPLIFDNCRVSADRMIGAPGQGFKIAMGTLDIFRASVGAAAIGASRRALDETLHRVTTRRMFGKTMAEMDAIQIKLADMAVRLETAAINVYRAAWTKDTTGGRCSREVSIAKLVATEAAQFILDEAVQIFGGMGVTRGCIIEKLYREVRPMRIYEGASEIQKLVIARDVLSVFEDSEKQ